MTKKATGIVRKVDELGRIVLPKELRRVYGINPNDSVEIFVTGEEIILRKYVPSTGCTFCGTVADHYADMGERRICPECARLIKERLGGVADDPF